MNQGARDTNEAAWQQKVLDRLDRIAAAIERGKPQVITVNATEPLTEEQIKMIRHQIETRSRLGRSAS